MSSINRNLYIELYSGERIFDCEEEKKKKKKEKNSEGLLGNIDDFRTRIVACYCVGCA